MADKECVDQQAAKAPARRASRRQLPTAPPAETPEEKRARCIREVVAKAPPITGEQRAKLVALLTGGASVRQPVNLNRVGIEHA